MPVFSRPSVKPARSNDFESPIAGASSTRPAGQFLSPRWISPRRKVPVVMTTAPADSSRPSARRMPVTRPFETISSSASPSITLRLAVSRDGGLHRRGIELAVGLGARTPHRRTLAAIEHAKLNAGGIGDPAHQPVQRIDLADQMALAEPTDRRIAGHRADGRKAMGHQRRLGAHARGGARGFAAGVASADDDNVE